jgi:hypothetical protein
MNTPMEIHEFSTGIRPERTATGWISRGFTGQYMNVTLERIPEVVERAIANREFALTEGASTEQPAVIGRVVGTQEQTWSVMAVVTRGKDEKGRSLSVYRYFLSEGEYSLQHIIAWWESQNRPTFNPFDMKNIGQPALFDDGQRPSNTDNYSRPELENLPLNEPKPLLLPPETEYDLRSINTLTRKKFNISQKNQPISWAFNVESLEKPLTFQIIQPASRRAHQIFTRLINQTPQVPTPVVGDEEALKTAIRTLMNSSQIKPDAVQTIIKALNNEETTSPYWHTLFDGQGAKTAISQKIYSPQMVRLITLRAMVIPETLPEFLTWLNVKGGNKDDEIQTVSLNFQAAIGKQFPKEKLSEGITFLLPHLLNQKITPETFHWIFIQDRAWYVCKNEFIKNVCDDLAKIYELCRIPQRNQNFPLESLKINNGIWTKFINSWSSIVQRSYQIEEYKPLAQLLEILEQFPLSAYFYQVSEGSVPKNVFANAKSKLQPRGRDYYVLGLRLKSKQNLIDKTGNFFPSIRGAMNDRFEFLIISVFLSLTIVLFFTAYKIYSLHHQTEAEKQINNSQINTKNPIQEISEEISENIKQKALDAFDAQTEKALAQLLKDEKINKITDNQEEIGKNFAKILGDETLEMTSTETTKNEREKLVKLIYKFQQKNNIENPDGIIKIPEDGKQQPTYEKLKEQIKEKLNSPTTP